MHYEQVGYIFEFRDDSAYASQWMLMYHIKGLKDKNYMIISIDTENAFDKIQHAFMIKIQDRVRVEGTQLNIMKAIYENPQPS